MRALARGYSCVRLVCGSVCGCVGAFWSGVGGGGFACVCLCVGACVCVSVRACVCARLHGCPRWRHRSFEDLLRYPRLCRREITHTHARPHSHSHSHARMHARARARTRTRGCAHLRFFALPPTQRNTRAQLDTYVQTNTMTDAHTHTYTKARARKDVCVCK